MIDDGSVVSEPFARAVAMTGFASPAGPEDEQGIVYFACACFHSDLVHRVEHFDDIGLGPARIACLKVAVEMIGAMVGAFLDAGAEGP